MTVGERIRALREQAGIPQTEFAEKLGISKQLLYKYETNRVTNVPIEKIEQSASILGVTPAVLMGWPDKTVRSFSSVRLPVYGRIAAGIPLEMITDIEDWEEIPADMADRGEFIALKIAGDSMEPRIRNGDVVIVRRQEDAETGDTVVATVNGCDATCKRLQKYADGIALLSNNQAYEPMIFTAQQVEELPVRILGKVVELRGKF